jgi:hypothetical protein
MNFLKFIVFLNPRVFEVRDYITNARKASKSYKQRMKIFMSKVCGGEKILNLLSGICQLNRNTKHIIEGKNSL